MKEGSTCILLVVAAEIYLREIQSFRGSRSLIIVIDVNLIDFHDRRVCLLFFKPCSAFRFGLEINATIVCLFELVSRRYTADCYWRTSLTSPRQLLFFLALRLPSWG